MTVLALFALLSNLLAITNLRISDCLLFTITPVVSRIYTITSINDVITTIDIVTVFNIQLRGKERLPIVTMDQAAVLIDNLGKIVVERGAGSRLHHEGRQIGRRDPINIVSFNAETEVKFIISAGLIDITSHVRLLLARLLTD